LCALVKANAYGHGDVWCAKAALAGGAAWLAVASAGEAAELRHHGIQAPILVMGALSVSELDIALDADADVVAWRLGFLERIGHRAARVHVKLDSGMGRLGTRDPAEANAVLAGVRGADSLVLAGAMTHFATADELGDDFFGEQLERFRAWAPDDVQRHAANSAGTLRDPEAHFEMVRCGIAVYGMDPFQEDPAARTLEPALSLRSYVADVKPIAAGESAGYGRRFVARQPTNLAVLPIGYGDGVRRGLTNNAEVVIGGRRYPLVGTVSMDTVTIDVGAEPEVAPGDEATLIGEGITAEEVARRLDTINYEVTCGITARVPRDHVR